MPPLLVLNPNTSTAVTQMLLQHLRGSEADVSPAPWLGCTAAWGAPYIADERSYCIAGHAVLDAWERAQARAPVEGFGGVLIGCFGDPGLEALREIAPVPVWGLAEASLHALWAQGPQRVAIVTGGLKWQHMLERWCRMHGYGTPAPATGCCVGGVHALEASGGQMMQSPDAAVLALGAACTQALVGGGCDAVLLGGAGLAGMGARVRAVTGLPVWDCVELVRRPGALHRTGASAATVA